MACWKVRRDGFRGSESLDDCCGAAEVVMAETEVPANRRKVCRGFRKRVGEEQRWKERREAWGFRNEMTKGKASMAIAAACAFLSLKLSKSQPLGLGWGFMMINFGGTRPFYLFMQGLSLTSPLFIYFFSFE